MPCTPRARRNPIRSELPAKAGRPVRPQSRRWRAVEPGLCELLQQRRALLRCHVPRGRDGTQSDLNFLQKQGAQYALNPAGGVQLNPAFVSFFNNAARFSDAMYPAGATEPNQI